MSLNLSARPEGNGWRIKATDLDSGHWAEFDQSGIVTARCDELSDAPETLTEWGKIVGQFLRRVP